MIDKIRVYNAGFGDCFLVYGTTDKNNLSFKLLVDAGTATPSATNEIDIIKDINTESGKGIYGMLTHFHEDHYKWFEKLKRDSFDVFYLPNFFTDMEIKFQLLALTFLSRRSAIYEFAHQLLLIVPNLLHNNIIKNNGEVHFVKLYDRIVDDIEILWPESRRNPNMEEIIEEIENKITVEQNRLINEIVDLYMELLTGEIIVQGERIVSIVDTIINLTNQLIGNNERGNILSRSDVEKIKKVQNQYSIVFHTTYVTQKNILFLGDVSSENFDKYICPKINDGYKILKVAHHGTKDYYSDNLPYSEKFIISNAKKGNWDITAKYAMKYPNPMFVCTNNSGCEIYNTLGQDCMIIKRALSTHPKGCYCSIGAGNFSMDINL
ncbi:MAG: hypothetical protein H2184_00025 [Candidatus Galacturonibacter soehngenii]|nr:hypothetical protein [Candidatus Galacturonibacter soehngenii]